jgi:hypothetical protein
VKVRLKYFRTLLNLGRLRYETYSGLKPVLRNSAESFHEKEKDIIIMVLKKGVISGEFLIPEPDQTASLFLDLIKGLRISVLNDKSTLFIEEEEFERLQSKTIAFTQIFIKGLKPCNS